MKKLLLLISLFCISNLQVLAQSTGVCNTFSNTTGLTTDPATNSKASFSVSNNELTITFTDANFWSDAIKWEFPNSIDISNVNTPAVSYEAMLVSVTVNGTGCSVVNYLPLGISLIDADGDYSAGKATDGIWQSSFTANTVDVAKNTAGVNYAAIKGISIQASSMSQGNCTAPTSVSGTIKIKNLNIGSSSCVTTEVKDALKVTRMNLFPNPASDQVTLNLEMKSQSNVKVVIVDMMGREVKNVAEGAMAVLEKTFSTSTLTAGTYAVNVLVDGSVVKSELLVVK